MAIGNPFQLGHTVTVGVISYRGRPFAMAEGRYQNMLQTDASINPGNSGGPLINVNGDVIGINSAILSNGSAGNIGIGFAVPINTVKTLLPQLRKGKVPRGRLGVQIRTQPLTDEDAKEFALPRPEGAVVVMVERDSPADRGGIRAGDVIVSYNGQQVRDGDQLVSLVSGTPAGTRVPISLYRDGRQERVTVTVEELQLDDNTVSASDRGQAPALVSRSTTSRQTWHAICACVGALTARSSLTLSRRVRLPRRASAAATSSWRSAVSGCIPPARRVAY